MVLQISANCRYLPRLAPANIYDFFTKYGEFAYMFAKYKQKFPWNKNDNINTSKDQEIRRTLTNIANHRISYYINIILPKNLHHSKINFFMLKMYVKMAKINMFKLDVRNVWSKLHMFVCLSDFLSFAFKIVFVVVVKFYLNDTFFFIAI